MLFTPSIQVCLSFRLLWHLVFIQVGCHMSKEILAHQSEKIRNSPISGLRMPAASVKFRMTINGPSLLEKMIATSKSIVFHVQC